MEKVKNLIGKAKSALKNRLDGVKENKVVCGIVDATKHFFELAATFAILFALVTGTILVSFGLTAGVLLIACAFAVALTQALELGTAWAIAFFLAMVYLMVR